MLSLFISGIHLRAKSNNQKYLKTQPKEKEKGMYVCSTHSHLMNQPQGAPECRKMGICTYEPQDYYNLLLKRLRRNNREN